MSSLASLQRLRLSINCLTDEGVRWDALCALSQLVVLALDSNPGLTALPDGISRLARLQKLSADGCRLAALPEALGRLSALRALSCAGNALAALPPGLGCCSALEEVDLSRNRIEELPRELGALTNLRALALDDNRWGAPVLAAGPGGLVVAEGVGGLRRATAASWLEAAGHQGPRPASRRRLPALPPAYPPIHSLPAHPAGSRRCRRRCCQGVTAWRRSRCTTTRSLWSD
jgi:hypothetical protein